jgi:beta-lactamase regulating signal transducer with metallopeptidase domain
MILEELATRLAWALIHSLWQGTIVALVAFILIGLVRGAAARHVIGMSAMTVILLLGISHLKQARPEMKEPVPGLVELAPVEALPTNGIAAPPVVVMEPVVNDPQRPAEVAIPEGSPLAPEQVIVEDASFQFLPWLSLVWLGGVLLLTLRHLGGWWLLRRWRMKGVNPVPEKIRIRALQIASRLKVTRDVPLLISDRVVVPLLVGVIKPVILLPVSLVGGIRPAELDALIAHELAHLRRRDGWANHLQIFIETLLFFHPAIWILGRLIRRERENAADDLALESGLDQRTYAGALASIAELGAQRGELALAANDGVLLSRIRRIVQADKARHVSPATGWLGTLALVATAMLCFSNPAASKSGEEKKVSETIKVAAGESIQAAIDLAKDHAVIEISEGTFVEEVVIKKPVTLRGAGWNKTLITSEAGAPRTMTSTIEIEGAKEVTLENLQVAKRGVAAKAESDNILVIVRASEIRIKKCALLGPATAGLILMEGSRAKVESSLVAAVWRTGIMVGGKKDGKPSTLHLDRSIVRSCYHRCITLGPGCDDSRITNSWISGSAWHGIRYDSASPHIEGNYIGGNARSGIYASGETKAMVKGNAFVGNEHGGMSCWLQNRDQIEGNRFVNNHREGMSVIGSSKPVLKSNVFLQKKGPAIRCSYTSSDPAFGDPVLKDNLVDFGGLPLQSGEDKISDIEGIAISKIALKGGIGEDFESLNRLWPNLLPQEQSMVPEGETRDSKKWKTPENESRKHESTMATARQNSQQWLADAFQLDDVPKREAAIAEMLEAVKSSAPFLQLSGLTAFTASGDVRFDKASFHDPAVALLGSPDPAIRSQAAGAVVLAGLREGDLQKIEKLTHDKDDQVRIAGAQTLVWALKKDLTKEPFAKRIAALLEDEATRKDILHSLWGATLSPEIEAAVLKLSNTTKVSEANTNDIAYTALYYSLSTQANKSEATVNRLVEYLAARDSHNIGGRAAWGLGQGVQPEQYDLVVKGALRFMTARTPQSYAFRQCLARVKQYAQKKNLPGIQKLLALPGVEGDLKKELEELAHHLGG